MKNKLYDTNVLYDMIRALYVNVFPQLPSKTLNLQVANRHMHALNNYLEEKDIPAKIKFTESYITQGKITPFLNNLEIEKDLKAISNLSPEMQNNILDHIDNSLSPQKRAIIEDIQDLEAWLVLNDYLRSVNNSQDLYITEKYINQKDLF